MKRLIFKYAILLFLILAIFKTLEYAFFSYKITLDTYLGFVALAFLLIGVLVARYWPSLRQSSLNSRQAPDPAVLQQFSNRELEVLQLLGHGYTNKELAQLLALSPNTVKTHLNNVYAKLQVTNRTQAVAEAKLLNLIE